MNSYNLYAYCSNNPVMYVDPTGNFLDATIAMFMFFVWGGRDYREFSDDSNVAQTLKSSKQMKGIIKHHIQEYEKNGKTHTDGTTTFNNEGETDLWLSVRSCTYTIDIISKKEIAIKNNIFELYYTVYSVSVTVSDYYNFDSGDEDKDKYSWLNNIGHAMEDLGLGKAYKWKVTYTQNI